SVLPRPGSPLPLPPARSIRTRLPRHRWRKRPAESRGESMRRRSWLGLAAGFLALHALSEPTNADESQASLTFQELYQTRGVLGMVFSEKTRALDHKEVRILGFMAPPLKPEVKFFVLTRAPVALCPFCNSDADWPSDIVVVYPKAREGWSQDGL